MIAWELVTYFARTRTSRMNVPGGWLVLVERSGEAFMHFVEDKQHAWTFPVPETSLDPHFDFKFLHLTTTAGNVVNVAIGEIALIEQQSGGSKITLAAGGPSIAVQETTIQISALMTDHRINQP